MEELTLAVPGMWADHHVLAVRDLLREDDAVTSTAASALEGAVHIEYDAARTDPQRIAALLSEGGYACGEARARQQVLHRQARLADGAGCASPPPTPSTWPCRATTASTDTLPPLPPVPSSPPRLRRGGTAPTSRLPSVPAAPQEMTNG